MKQNVDVWSLGCILSEAAVWVVRGKFGLSEYRRRRGIETARVQGFRDGDCFHDGLEVLNTVTETHKNLIEEIRSSDHVTGATVDMVTKEMLIISDFRSSAKNLGYRTKTILEAAETKLKRNGSYAGTGSVFGTDAPSPPRTPPEPPPGHGQPRSSNSHSRHLPSHIYAGRPASTSYYKNEAYNQRAADDFSGERAFWQAHYSDRPTRRQSTGPATHPDYTENQDQDQFRGSYSNGVFTDVVLSQESPSSRPWQESLGTHRKRHRTPPGLFSGASTRNSPDFFAQDQQETYNHNQRNSFTAPPEGVSRTSTATLIPNLHNDSRAGQHHPNIASGMQHPRLVSIGPLGTQPRRRPHFLSVTNAQQWKSDKKGHRSVRLPDDHLLADLNERDYVSQSCIHCSQYSPYCQVFLIDNSESMRPYRKEVLDLFGLLGYMVKEKDPDGIELHFTMSRNRKERARNTGQLLRNLETVQYFGTSNVRTQLGYILQEYYAKLKDQKPTRSLFKRMRSPRPVRRQNVYILTDGVWQPCCNPIPMIKTLVDNLEQNSMEREQFGIQFIRFGNDPHGIHRLNQLDSGLGLSMYAPSCLSIRGMVLTIVQGHCRYRTFERQRMEDASRRSQRLVRRRRCQRQPQRGGFPHCRYISEDKQFTPIRKAVYTHVVHL